MSLYKSALIFIVLCTFFVITKNAYADYALMERLSTEKEFYQNSRWKNLLHYDGKQSVINKQSPFFLSKIGYKDPKSEYLATLKRIFADVSQGDDHIICKYPARFSYIKEVLNLKNSNFKIPECKLYSEYRRKVPVSTVSIIFASENNVSPSSMMGHSFIKLSGEVDGKLKEHAFSYFAHINDTHSLSFYFKVMTTGADGIYILSPYQQKEEEYLYQDKRSLWEFELDLSQKEKERLKEHLWELKEKDISYSFISHNCNTALISILKTASDRFDMQSQKPFITPVEYIQNLNEKHFIQNVSITPSNYTAKKIKQKKLGNILDAPKSSRVSVVYEHYTNNYLNFEFSPVYQDIRDNSGAYSDELESKMMEFNAGMNVDNGKLFLRNIDILRMKSILDYSLNRDLSKYFRLAMESDLGNEKSELRPTAEFGLGYAYNTGRVTAYILPKAGYRYHDYGNFYLSPELGIISRINKSLKIVTSYSSYLDFNDNNRGYKSEYQFYGGYTLKKDTDVFVKYSFYTDAVENNRIGIGLTKHF